MISCASCFQKGNSSHTRENITQISKAAPDSGAALLHKEEQIYEQL
nr:MAG TPA: hypothetical protein [Caudoviricetes sp.]